MTGPGSEATLALPGRRPPTMPLRVAGVIVLLYAQPLTRVVRLTVDDVLRTGDAVLLRLREPASPVAADALGHHDKTTTRILRETGGTWSRYDGPLLLRVLRTYAMADLTRPRIKALDHSARLGPGWTLTQREGDAERHRWLVEHDRTVRGMVYRYQRLNGTLRCRGLRRTA